MRGFLALIVLCMCKRMTAGSRRHVILQEIYRSMCTWSTGGVHSQVLRMLKLCGQDGIPPDRLLELCDPRIVIDKNKLECDATCPNQTASDVVWNIHLMSLNRNIALSCNSNNCTSVNEDTRILELEQEFTVNTNNTLQFEYLSFFYESLVGCVVTSGSCMNTTYYLLKKSILGYPKLPATITYPPNNKVYRAALGENLFAKCEAFNEDIVTSLLFWRQGLSDVKQFHGHCSNLNLSNSSCISPPVDFNKYKRLRVKSYTIHTGDCGLSRYLKSYLDISIVDWSDNGSYTCLTSSNNNTDTVLVDIIVDVLPEFLQQSNSSDNIVVVTDTNSSHSCVAKAGWGAKLQWMNNGGDVILEWKPNDTSLPYVTYSMTNTSTELTVNNPGYTVDPIRSVYPVHNATIHYPAENNTFHCVITGVNEDFLKQYNVSNLTYSITVVADLSLDESFKFSTGSITGSVIGTALILIIVVLITLLCYAKYRQQSKHSIISAQSPFSHFTAELGIGSKCISQKVHFPREKVTLLHVIGEGHFGIVWKAKAEGIVQNAPDRNIVAIKTVKETAKEGAANDLWSELDILMKIEPHPNICNLLGCCDDEAKSLCIMLEYCMFGRLLDYLRSCNSALEKLELPIELQDYQNSGKGKESSCSTDYINILRSTASSSSYAKLLRKASVGSMQSDSVFCDSSIAYAPESIDSDYSLSSYAGSMITVSRDYENSPGPLNNEDVANFALQIAHGLQHLEKLKVYHGDMAARNILIAEGFVLKIADFGHARELHNREYYKRQTDRALPVKWMAIESMRAESLCTHKSDIWSYGVVLWEITTYGKSPYEVVPITDMLRHLEEGHRLPFPSGCSDAWYKLMMRCWSEDAEKRPSASQMTELLVKPPFYCPSAVTQLMTAV